MPRDLPDFFCPVNISEASVGTSMALEKNLKELSFDELSIHSKLEKGKKSVVVKHNQNDCLVCCRKYIEIPIDIAVEKSLSSLSPETNENEQIVDNKYWSFIIKHVKKIANPVWSKQSKHKLLDLKQRHPYSFQNICLYSEVSKILGCFSFRPSARRFVQEIFYDLDFKSFYDICPGNNPKFDFKTNKLLGLEKSSNLKDESDLCLVQNEQDAESISCVSNSSYNHFDQALLPKPKFNTFELDLSCTKNIFPIRQRENEKTSNSKPK